MKRIYLDYAATSLTYPSVRAVMEEVSQLIGNPSSLHAEGRAAKARIDDAREAVSARLGCRFAEVIFTSGGTEAANLAIVGTALAHQGSRRRILVSAAEHHAVLHAEGLLCSLGYRMECIPVDSKARVRMDWLHETILDDVLLVSVMHANNELGTVNPIAEVAEICRAKGVLVHTDAVQTFGKLSYTVDELGVDLLSVSAHKLGGPKGAGALYIRAGTPVRPVLSGGGQERELRAGTENVVAIAGFRQAIREPYDSSSVKSVRDRLAQGLAKTGFCFSVADDTRQLPSHVHGRYPDIEAETMLIRLDRQGISASSGAACSSGSIEPSHVLIACGYSPEVARTGIRLSVGPETTPEEATEAATRIGQTAAEILRLRGSFKS